MLATALWWGTLAKPIHDLGTVQISVCRKDSLQMNIQSVTITWCDAKDGYIMVCNSWAGQFCSVIGARDALVCVPLILL